MCVFACVYVCVHTPARVNGARFEPVVVFGAGPVDVFESQGIEDSNTFRRTRLYNLATDLELRKWYYGMLKVFNAYSDRTVGML